MTSKLHKLSNSRNYNVHYQQIDPKSSVRCDLLREIESSNVIIHPEQTPVVWKTSHYEVDRPKSEDKFITFEWNLNKYYKEQERYLINQRLKGRTVAVIASTKNV